jgi:hypothetical protein
MTEKRPSSETVATAALTVISLVGGLAVACTAGVGVRPVKQAVVPPPQVLNIPAAPAPAPAPADEPAPDNPRLLFPTDAVVDVKAAYGAKGDGSTDDTGALQKAITENPGRTLYLPAGTYLVSNALEARDRQGRPQAGLRLIGEQRDTTVIKLKNGASGFGDHWSPRPLLRAGSTSTAGVGRPDEASGYGNVLENLTVDTGSNPGATAIDYTGSSIAAIRRITITGNGPSGLSVTRGLPGPALISRLVVKGFDYGIRVAQGQYGLTLEHVSLSDQKIAGIDNGGNILAIRDLTSVNAIPAIRSGDRDGLISLVDAKLTGGTADFSAIQSNGELMARRVSTAGYRSAVTRGGRIIAGNDLSQYASTTPVVPFPETPSRAVNLPVRETPEFFPSQAGDWVSVAAYGAKPDDGKDDTAAFQKALDSGKPVVYLPTGQYVISKPLHVKGAVRQIVGFGSTLTPDGTAWGDARTPAALIRVDDGTAPDVTVSGLRIAAPAATAPSAGLIAFAQHTARPLVLRDVDCVDATTSYQAGSGAGPLYLEDVSAAGWQFDQPQQVWARQFHHLDRNGGSENWSPLLVNAGATVWMLGLETERSGPVLRTERDGRTEVLGGAVYEAPSGNAVAFECLDGASMVLSFATMGPGYGVYQVLAREHQGPTTKDLPRGQASRRGDGRAVPLYAG